MRVQMCGVRGSTPAPGEAFSRYGGHTSCVALAHDGAPPTLILDAGTGIRQVTRLLNGAPFQGTILLGHLHWDHTQGLPFFGAGDRFDARVGLLMPEQGDAVDVLARAMSPPHFPIAPTELRGEWHIAALEPGLHHVEGFEVLALDIPHKGGRSFGYRITDGHSAVAYLSDHGPITMGAGPDGWGPYHHAALALADGVDVLFHDAQHTAEELPEKAAFGHSAAEYAVALGERAGAVHVVLFHHDPERTDDEVDVLLGRFAGAKVGVSAAAEGTVLDLS
jgi:phosphoribosyl 1,2-cyclic phosphodiesterase